MKGSLPSIKTNTDDNRIDMYMLEVYNPCRTGYDTFREEFLKGMRQCGLFNIYVVVEEFPAKQIQEEQKEEATYIYLPPTQHDKFAALEAYLKQTIRETERMVFISNFFPAIFNIKAIRHLFPQARIVHIIHDLPWLSFFGGDENEYINYLCKEESRILTPQEDKFIRYCTYDMNASFQLTDKIVSLCRSTYRMMTEFYDIPSEKVCLIPNGMEDHAFINFGEEERLHLKLKYRLPLSGKLILMVGRLTHSKGADRIGQWLDYIKPTTGHHLIYAGPDDIFSWFPSSMAHSVVSIGFKKQPELSEIYAAVDLGLFPSRHEQCSYAGIEFLMHGIPVIATSAYGVRDMFNLKNAFMIPATGKSIATKDIRNKRKEARKSFLKKHTGKAMKEQYISLILNLFSNQL